jgi:predicted RNA binding protein YcfA (HicA-like mRNA interferase family)
MSRLPIVDVRTMERVLLDLGFVKTRQRGSHAFYRHADGRTTTLPHHGGRDLARPLIRAILREIELPPEEFQRRLERPPRSK